MKLDWKRAGCGSIAASGDFSFLCEFIGEGRWVVQVRRGSGALVEGDTLSGTMSSAEGWHESWLERNDRPEWHDVTDWLSWAEWRGVKLVLRPWGNGCRDGVWRFQSVGRSNDADYGRGGESRESAKSAAEKWVREQGAQ